MRCLVAPIHLFTKLYVKNSNFVFLYISNGNSDKKITYLNCTVYAKRILNVYISLFAIYASYRFIENFRFYFVVHNGQFQQHVLSIFSIPHMEYNMK